MICQHLSVSKIYMFLIENTGLSTQLIDEKHTNKLTDRYYQMHCLPAFMIQYMIFDIHSSPKEVHMKITLIFSGPKVTDPNLGSF